MARPAMAPAKVTRTDLPGGGFILRSLSAEADQEALDVIERLIAQIEEGPVARKILAHLGLPTTLPARTPVRPQAQVELWGTGPPEDEAAEFDAPPPYDYDQRTPASDLVA